MPAREVISDEVAYPPKFGSPTCNAMRAGDFIYVSGMMPWDKERKLVGIGDVKAQTRQVLKNMDAMLQAEGGSLKNIIKINFFLTDIRDKTAVSDVRKEMLAECAASTLVRRGRASSIRLSLEVEAVAYMGN